MTKTEVSTFYSRFPKARCLFKSAMNNKTLTLTLLFFLLLILIIAYLANEHYHRTIELRQKSLIIESLDKPSINYEIKAKKHLQNISLFDDLNDLSNSLELDQNLLLIRTKLNRSRFITKKDKYEIKIVLPGFSKENIDIRMTNGVLEINAKKESLDNADERSKTIEKSDSSISLYGYSSDIQSEKEVSMWHNEFTYSIEVPQDINEKKIDTLLANGILTITMPRNNIKTEIDRKIEVKQ